MVAGISARRTLRPLPSFRYSAARVRAHGLLVAIVALGAALRFATLNTQSFDLDESVTVALLHHSFSGMLSTIPRTESTPPLYYMLAWPWTKLFGLNEIGLRSLSALLGTAMIPLAYRVTRRLSSARPALIAAALIAVSPWLLWYSQEARAYSLFAFLSLASFAAFVQVLETPTTRGVALWALLSALALASHYFAVFLIAPEALWLLILSHPRRRALAGVTPVVAVGLALMPLVVKQAADLGSKAGFLQTPLDSRITAVPTHFLIGEAVPGQVRIAALLISFALLIPGAIGLLLARADYREQLYRYWIVFSIAAFAVIFPILLALAGRDYLDARNLVGAWAPLVIVLAVGYAMLGRIGILGATALATVFLAVSIVSESDYKLERTDYRGLATALGASPGPGQRALVVSPDFNWTPLAYYLPKYPQLSSGNVAIKEIELIGWRSSGLSAGARRLLGSYGFRLTDQRVVQKLRLVRFSSPAVRSISRASLLRARLSDRGGTVLIQSR